MPRAEAAPARAAVPPLPSPAAPPLPSAAVPPLPPGPLPPGLVEAGVTAPLSKRELETEGLLALAATTDARGAGGARGGGGGGGGGGDGGGGGGEGGGVAAAAAAAADARALPCATVRGALSVLCADPRNRVVVTSRASCAELQAA